MVDSKPPAIQPKFRLLIRYTFRKSASSVSPRDISAIEHLLRAGKRQIEMYEDPSVKDCWISKEMQEWAESEHQHRQ
jgi:succinate dehydrogenase assembly factor 1